MSFDINNLYGVILAGGSGSRLWPLSRKARPKQFIDIFDSGQTMLQLSAERVRDFIPIERIIVVTNKDFLEDIMKQIPRLPKENIILEPMAKNTATAMGVAAAIISKRNKNAVIVNLPSDHLILETDNFRKTILAAAKAVAEQEIISIIGVQPTFPHTGLGYIKIGDEETRIGKHVLFKVAEFTEKPDEATAYAFLSSGKYLWNANYYTYHVGTFLQNLNIHMPKLYMSLQKIEKTENKTQMSKAIQSIYEEASDVPIDTEMTEKASNICVIPADFTWSDIGNWGELYSILSDTKMDDLSNVVISPNRKYILNHDSNGNLIYQTKKKPLALVGIKDSVIVDLEDALLIAKRSDIQEVKKIVEKLKTIDVSCI